MLAAAAACLARLRGLITTSCAVGELAYNYSMAANG